MEIKALFGILSAIFILIGIFPYLRDVHNKRVNPHILTWIGWAFVTALGAFAMLASGSEWIVVILFANSFLCVFIAIYSIVEKVGIWSTTNWDYMFFGLGIVGLILWQTFGMPILALICSILADFSFGLPTMIKTLKNPRTETYFIWLTASIADFFSLLSAKSFTFSELAFSTYLFMFETIMLLIILNGLRKNPTVKVRS
jgi:hypothetical protein